MATLYSIRNRIVCCLTLHAGPPSAPQQRGGGFINATDCADYLTRKGMAFRDAYTTVGNLVYYCTQQGKLLEELTLEELKNISPLFGEDVYEALSLKTCMGQRRSHGSSSFSKVLPIPFFFLSGITNNSDT